MLHFDDIVFGPIISRRLGTSLGVNLLPSKGKLCNFDCIYCECGWNEDGRCDGRLPSYEEVEAGGKTFILAHAGINNFDAEKELEDYSEEDFVFAQTSPPSYIRHT